MNPAPKVANPTPKIIIFVGNLRLYMEEIKAVKTTYKEVKNAETDGSISSSPIICERYARNMSVPKINPSSQICLSARDVLAFLKIIAS